MTLDPITLARFLVLPGAAELVAAFSRIPPGKLRASAVAHVEAMAETYDDAIRAGAAIPDPLASAAGRPPPRSPPVLPEASATPDDAAPSVRTDDPLTRAVELRLRGKDPRRIAQALGLTTPQVREALKAARAAGVKLPSLKDAAPRPAPPSPAPPPEPAVWPTPYDQQDPAAQKLTRFMAKAAGLSVAEQQAREAEVVRRLQAGEYPVQIAPALGLSLHKIKTLAVRAQHDGVVLPKLKTGSAARKAMGQPVGGAATPRAERPSPPAPGRVFGPLDAMPNRRKAGLKAAAVRMGMTADALLSLHESAVAYRLAGKGAVEIAALTGLGETVIYSTLDRARGLGVVFPELPARTLQPAT